MALPILDGNQTAATLSTIITGGAHIPAHTVVSLGSTAISNIASAVSGITVTAPQLNKLIESVGLDGLSDATTNFVKIGGHQDGQNQISHIVHVSSGGAMKVDASDSAVTFSAIAVSNFPSTQTIAGTVTVGNEIQIQSGNISIEEAFGESSFMPISGTVTANVFRNSDITAQDGDERPAGSVNIGFYSDGDAEFRSVKSSQPLPISGTVTANAGNFGFDENQSLTVGGEKGILVGWYDDTSGEYRRAGDATPLPISGTVTVGNSVTIGSVPNGSLTTRFGTPTTANTAFATSAVTNANRKYLLIQNVTTGSNVITVGIGFTPTTTQGIQLTAGAGITFESSYIPTGAVQILSSVTASNFTILEA